MDTTLCTIAVNAMLDVIWPLLPAHTLDELAHV